MTIAHPPLPCRASPPQGGRSASGKNFAQVASSKTGEASLHPISPLVGAMSGRTEGGNTASRITEAAR